MPKHISKNLFSTFLLDLAPYRYWLTDAVDHYNSVLRHGGGVALYASVGENHGRSRKDGYRMDLYGGLTRKARPAEEFPRPEPGERFVLLSVYVGERIEFSAEQIAAVPVGTRGDESMVRDWIKILTEAPDVPPRIKVFVHECTDGEERDRDGRVTYSLRDHTGSCGCWTVHGPYDSEEPALAWRSSRHVIILLGEEGPEQRPIAEFIGGLETERSLRWRGNQRTSIELGGVEVVDFSDGWKQMTVRPPSGPSGTCNFITWEPGAAEAKHFSAEGDLRAKLMIPPRATYADVFNLVLGRFGGHITGYSVKFSTRIYGAED